MFGALGSLGVPQSASAAGSECSGLCVVVTVISGTQTVSTTQFTPADLTKLVDITDATYQIRTATSTNGATQSEPVSQGVSIRALAGAPGVNVPPDSIRYAGVTIGGLAGPSLLNSATGDFGLPSPFQGGLEPVVYVAGPSTLEYLRPLRNDTDVNNKDVRLTDATLNVTVHLTGSLLIPKISAQPSTVDPGKVVSFGATTPSTDESLVWTWHFGDGAGTGPQSQTAATHAYSTAGRYFAYVDVTGDNGSSGQSDTVSITVNGTPPPKPPDPGKGGSHNGGGGKNNPVGGPNSGKGHAAGGAPRSKHASAPAAGGSSSTRAGAPVAAASGSAAAPGSAAASAGAASGGAAPARDSATSSSRPSGVSVGGAGNRVVGYILAGDQAGSVQTDGAKAEVPSAPALRASITTGHVVAAALGVLAVLVLLALGAGTELRRPRRRPGRQGR